MCLCFHNSQNLMILDVSNNMLTSAKLGSKPQLPHLMALTLSHNAISTLKKEDFYFLSRSPSLRVLNMANLPLKKVLKKQEILKSLFLIMVYTVDLC